MNYMTEIVKLKTLEGVTSDTFQEIVHHLEVDFHIRQEGYVDTELLFDEKEEVWIMLQHWETMEHLKNASNKMFKESSTENFRNALDPKSVEIKVYPQLKCWSKS